MEIKKENLEKLNNMRDLNLQIRNSIGDIELRKQELLVQYMQIRHNMQKEAEKFLIEAGVPVSETKEYRIDLKTGECLKETNKE